MALKWWLIGGMTIVAVGVIILQLAISREVLSDMTVLNPNGQSGNALIVYHPGLSNMQQELAHRFAEGLIAHDWRVAITTTSHNAPTELSAYDLLVLGVHTYWWAPDRPTRRYLARLDLQGKPTVALLSALGAAERAKVKTTERIERAGGQVLTVMPVFVLRPNDETDRRPNRLVGLEKVYTLAYSLASP